MKHVWPSLLFVLSLAACSEFETIRSEGYAPVVTPVVTRDSGIDYWLTELHDTRGMAPEEIRQTVEGWEWQLREDPSTGNRIKLALLLTAGDTPARDTKRARELLDGINPAPFDTGEQELITILRQIIDEQNQADMALNKLKKQASLQSQRIRELEEQQRALTDIEQNIQQRETQPGLENGGQ